MGTVASALYGIAGLVLTLGSLFANFGDPYTWVRLHLAFAITSVVLLIAASVLQPFCSTDLYLSTSHKLFRDLGFGCGGVLCTDIRLCGSVWNVVPELAAASCGIMALLLRWLVAVAGLHSHVSAHHSPRASSPLRVIMIHALLVLAASLDTNIFSGIYMLTTALVLGNFILVPRECSCRKHFANSLKACVVVVAFVHIVTFGTFGALRSSVNVPGMILRLLGVAATAPCLFQTLVIVVLMQVLLWTVTTTSTQHDGAAGIQASQTSAAGLGRSLVTIPATELELRGCSREDTVSSGNLQESGLHQRSQFHRSSTGISHLSGTTVSVRSYFPRAPTLQEVTATVTGAMSNGLHNACKSVWLPMLSFLAWPVNWPSVATLPLLLAGLLLMYPFIKTTPLWILHVGLVYELLLGTIIYMYTIVCSAQGSPPSHVPSVFTWPERLGLQSLIRAENHLPPLLDQLVSVFVQAVSIGALALTVHMRHSGPVQTGQMGALSLRMSQLLTLFQPVMRVFLCTPALFVALLAEICFQEASVVSLVYVLWIILYGARRACTPLARSESYTVNTSHTAWLVLLTLSSGTLVFKMCWQIFSQTSLGKAGIHRVWGVHPGAWLHLAVSMLASVHCCAKASIPDVGLLWDSATWLLKASGTVCVLALLALLSVLSPYAIDSLAVLLLCTVSILRDMFKTAPGTRFSFLWATFIISASMLLSQYLYLIPGIARFFQSEKHGPLFLSLSFTYTKDVHARLVLEILLVLLTSTLLRVRHVGSELGSRSIVLAKVFHTCSIFILMGLEFVFVALAPVAVDSIIVILLFITTVGMEHFRPKPHLKRGLLVVTAILSALLLVVRFTLLIPLIQNLLSLKPRDLIIHDAFALGGSNTRYKNAMLGFSLLLSSWLYRAQKYILHDQAVESDGQFDAERFFARCPILKQWLVLGARWSQILLMFGAYFLMLRTDALAFMQMVVLISLLVTGRLWEYAGAFISACSMILLFVQYVTRFDFVNIEPVQEKYWGIGWNSRAVGQELALLGLGICQRIVQRAASFFEQETFTPSGSRVLRVWDIFVGYSVHMALTLILFDAVVQTCPWSFLNSSVVLLFILKPTRICRYEPASANRVLFFLALLMAITLVYRLFLLTWFPPDSGLPGRLNAGAFDTWLTCPGFLDAPLVNATGQTCTVGTDCTTQRIRCGQAWLQYLEVYAAPVDSALDFIILFAIGLMRKLCMMFMHRLDHLHRPSIPIAHSPTSDTVCQSSTLALPFTRSEDTQDEECSFRQTSSDQESDAESLIVPFVAVVSSRCAVWVALAAAAMQQPWTSVVSVGYMALLCLQVVLSQVLLSEEHHRALNKRALHFILVFCAIVSFWSIICQLPLIPCAFSMSIDSSLQSETLFVSPSQCTRLQSSKGTDLGKHEKLSDLLRFLGIWKSDRDAHFDGAIPWNLLVFITSMLHELMSKSWVVAMKSLVESEKRRMDWRDGCYVRYLTVWRRSELSAFTTKKRLLLFKLQRLIVRLKELRAHWEQPSSGERIYRHITKEEALAREREARVVELCLQSGRSMTDVENLLLDFEQACSTGDQVQENTALQATVDQCVLEFLDVQRLCQLGQISQQEEDLRKKELLVKCRSAHGNPEDTDKPVDVATPPTSCEATQSYALVDDMEMSSASLGSREGLIPEEADETEEPQAPADSSETQQGLGSPSSPVPSQTSTQKKYFSFLESLVQALRRLLEGFINDLLFVTAKDETMHTHRDKDWLCVLALKALYSQTLVFLFLCAILQFVNYRSVLSSINLCAILLSFMVFPHAPPSVWKVLQFYNISIILLKIMYQLLTLWSNVRYQPNASWTSILGVLPVDSSQQQDEVLAYSSLLQGLWPDMLMCATLFVHSYALGHSGRLQHSASVCAMLDMNEEESVEASEGVFQDPVDIRTLSRPHPSYGSSTQPISEEEESHSDGPNVNNPPVEATHDNAVGITWSSSHGSVVEDGTEGSQINCAQKAFIATGLISVRDAIPKPARDLYHFRLLLALWCFILMLLCWNQLTGGGRSFTRSLSNNVFSGNQVIAVILFLAMIVVDRGLYTLQMQDSVDSPQAHRRNTAQDSSVPRHLSVCSQICETQLELLTGAVEPSSLKQDDRLVSIACQKLMLISQLIALQVVSIWQWASIPRVSYNEVSMFGNSIYLMFYVTYICFLALSSVQLRYDIHLVRGGLGFTHSTDLANWLMLKGYLAVPFLEELRVLTDWTVTRTSLDFYMWMKLEDAHQCLYITKRAMEWKHALPPATPRPVSEKVLQGGLCIFGLFVLIVGPLVLFSTLNPSLVNNPVYSVELLASLEVSTQKAGLRSTILYSAGQDSLRTLSQNEAWTFFNDNANAGYNPQDVYLQLIGFPEVSDQFWSLSASVQARLISMTEDQSASVNLIMSYTFHSKGSTTPASGKQRTILSHNSTLVFQNLLNQTTYDTQASVIIPGAYTPSVVVEDAGKLTFSPPKGPVTLCVSTGSNTSRVLPSLPFWSMNLEGGAPLSMYIATSKSAPPLFGAGQSWSLIGLLTVVYTVGRLLRTMFQDTSKRMIFDEMPNTDLLCDLCNGIYISRMQGLLRMEYRLYDQLVEIYRSPEALLDVSKSKDKRTEDEIDWATDLSADLHGSAVTGRKSEPKRRRRPTEDAQIMLGEVDRVDHF